MQKYHVYYDLIKVLYRVALSALGQDLVLNTWAVDTNAKVINLSKGTYKKEFCTRLSLTQYLS